jgi:hypothetical protein
MMAANGFAILLAAALVLAASPSIVFIRLSPPQRAARRLLPWISLVGIAAIATFVALVNFGVLTP